MEKSTKHEYVAVPTGDVDQEAVLPAYEAQETAPVDNTNRKRTSFFIFNSFVN
jgi:hypothetical protein